MTTATPPTPTALRGGAPEALPGSPLRITTRRTGLGVDLDVSGLVEALLRELADQFTADPDEVGDVLEQIATLSTRAVYERGMDGRGYAEHERDVLVDELVDRLGGAVVPLPVSSARVLAGRLARSAEAGEDR